MSYGNHMLRWLKGDFSKLIDLSMGYCHHGIKLGVQFVVNLDHSEEATSSFHQLQRRHSVP